MDKLEAVEKDDRSGNFNLKNVERTGTNVLSVENLSIGYPEITLAKNIDFLLHRGECLGVIGGNGTGKTTFLKTILGDIRELSGKLTWGTKINLGYYSQQLEELDKNNDLIQEMRKINPLAESGELRSFLALFLFFGEDVFKRIGDLSGGEKGRLSLAKLIYSKSNVLILDEPTNHLDIPSREALEEALSNYDGTIITVSHDRYFLDQVATQIFSFEDDNKIEIYNGNYTQYHDWKEKRMASGEKRPESKTNESQANSETPKVLAQSLNSNSLSKNEIQKIENRIVVIEEEIAVKEEDLKKLTLQMSSSEIIADNDQFQTITRKYQITEQSIQNLYNEWEELLEKLS
jgi:ATP-binding cassette subfamily F protein 3